MPLRYSGFDGLKVVALAGGVGGAKLARGLRLVLGAGQLSLVVNTGDDFNCMGLPISPDLDSVCYGIAALNDPVRGWGLADESWSVFEQLRTLGGQDWFRLGDKDLATHLMRAYYLQNGLRLTEATARLCRSWGIETAVLPMADCPCPTKIQLRDGRVLPFQEYFVKEACKPEVEAILLPAQEKIKTTQPVSEALQDCDLVIFCPSNPWLSIDPILNIAEIRRLVARKPVVAVSPFIGGKAVKGPAAKLALELGHGTDTQALIRHYEGLLGAVLCDRQDLPRAAEKDGQGIILKGSDTLMKNDQDKCRVARQALELGLELVRRCSE